MSDEEKGTPQITPVSGGTGSDDVLTPAAGVEVDIETARSLEARGDIETAAAAYIAVANAEPEHRSEAGLSAGRLLLELERNEHARLLLEALLKGDDRAVEDIAANYMLGRAYAALGMWEESVQQFDIYLASGRPAEPYAYLDRGASLLALERGFEAAQSIQRGMQLGVPAATGREFLLRTAQAYERVGAFDEALEWYGALLDESGLSGDAALALSRIASLKQIQEDPTFVEERSELLANYPSSVQALTVLQEMLGANEDVAPVVRGLIYYRHNEYTTAEPHFQEQIDAAPEAPESATAYYYLAAIQESRGEIEEALDNYALVDARDPESPLADDALWWQARLFEQQEELGLAGELYARIVSDYPSSQFVADASFRRGLLPYLDGEYIEAASIWEEDLAATSEAASRHRLQLWQAKALLKALQEAAALPILDELSAAYEDDYAGVRASSLRAGAHEQPAATMEEHIGLIPEWDWAAAEEWLATATGQPADSRPWETDERWERAHELWRVGRPSYGDLEIFDMLDSYEEDPAAMYTLSRALKDEGRVSMSARAGQRLLRTLEENPSDGLPKALLSLSYPAAFGPLVERYAEAEGISPLLLLAFIRQESFFNPRAISPAGALGLTQVLPTTASSMATDMGIGEVARDELLHAELNLRLGARYMADQLDRFDEEVFVALAAYNAGPGAAARWREAAGEDADLYLESVEFAETRLYLELVAENYALYRYIYTDEPEPNLPH